MEALSDTLKRCCVLLSGALNINCFYTDDGGRSSDENIICRLCSSLQKDAFNHIECERLHTDSLGQSEKWGGRYEYLCPLGMGFASSAVLVGGKARYALIAGPFLMVEYDDFIDEDLPNLFHDHATEELASVAKSAPYIKFGRVQSISEIVNIITNNVISMAQLQQGRQKAASISGSETFEILYNNKDKKDVSVLQGINEEKLVGAMLDGDAKAADSIANDILSEMYTSGNGDIDVIKARVVSLLNRVFEEAINIGGSISNILLMHGNYLAELDNKDDPREVDAWFLYAIRNIMNNVFPQFKTKNAGVIDSIKSYIERNYMGKILLNDLSDMVMLSTPYLCKIFKESTFMSIGTYINMIRINSAKKLLCDIDISIVDVASLVGFDDQSYFTKIFRKFEGISPGKFRQLNLNKQ